MSETAPCGPPPGCQYLTIEMLCEYLAVSEKQVRTMIDQGKLPQPVRFGKRCVRWQIDQVRSHLSRLAS